MNEVLVNDVQCEKMVLGILISYPGEFPVTIDILTPEMFYDGKHSSIFQALIDMYAESESIDPIRVFEHLVKNQKTISQNEIWDITLGVATTFNLRENCIRINRLWKRRKMWELGQKLVALGTNEFGDENEIKEEVVESLNMIDSLVTPSFKSNLEVAKKVSDIISENLARKEAVLIPTGFDEIDSKGGLVPSDLVLIAAELSQGKTSLAIDFIVNAARHGFVSAIFSLEMTTEQLVARMLATETGVLSTRILWRPLEDRELKEVEKGLGKVEGLPIFYDDTTSLSFEKMVQSIRYLHRKKNISLVVIDFLQILQNNQRLRGQTEEQFFGMVARMLKNLAKELNICIILLSQLSRSIDSPEPSLSRLRGSGQPAEAADVVLLIYRPSEYQKKYSGDFSSYQTQGTALIKIAKGRNIGTSEFICKYDKERTHFSPIENIADYQILSTGSDETPSWCREKSR